MRARTYLTSGVGVCAAAAVSAALVGMPVGVAAPAPSPAPASSTSVVSDGAVWKYNNSGASLGTGWRSRTYSDKAWKAGAAELGYGDGDEATVIGSVYRTAYFRKSFTVKDTAVVSAAHVDVVADDGYVVYVNGMEAARTNMPSGTVSYSTAASTYVGHDGSQWDTVTVPVSRLRSGGNVIAVEVHQAGAGAQMSTDLTFNARVRVTPKPTATPTPTPTPTATLKPSPTPSPTPTPTVSSPSTQPLLPGRSLVWSDEFNSPALDATRWGAYHNTYGDGNNELACLTPNNVTVTGGMAVITSKKEPITCPGQPTDQYSSAFLGSREAGKYYPLYGRYEIRVQMAHAQGIWPAFWLRHRNGSGAAEVDILESFHNQVPGKMTQTLHLPTTAGRNIWKKSTFVETPPAASAPGAWHTYAVDISPVTAADGSTDIKFEYFIDNKSTGFYIHTAPEGWNTADPNASWDIAVNQAVGGNWVGHPEKQLGYLPYPNKCSLTYKTPVNADPTTCPTTGIQLATFPVKYHVDYVRVYAPVS